jgi:citrate synthase
MKKSRVAWISAEEATERLGVSRATLYAYVSRGRIRSEPVPGDSRRRQYSGEDIEGLLARGGERIDPQKAASQALHYGLPILESAITLISEGRIYYRGHDASELAGSRSVAEVAALMWTGDFETESLGTRWPSVVPFRAVAGFSFIGRAQCALATVSAADSGAYDLREPALIQAGWRIVNILAQVAAARANENESVDALLAGSWRVAKARDAIRMALILCADHELNVSAFTARCVASAGASVYGVVIAGLAALEGYKHGGATARVESLWDSLAGSRDLKRSLDLRLRRGESIEGFGHPLYPAGDPRAASLLALLAPSKETDFAHRLMAAAYDVLEERPVVDFALVALVRSLKLPNGTALTLFALGRTIGWVAQAIEQYAADTMIRPRARYVGEVPSAGQDV